YSRLALSIRDGRRGKAVFLAPTTTGGSRMSRPRPVERVVGADARAGELVEEGAHRGLARRRPERHDVEAVLVAGGGDDAAAERQAEDRAAAADEETPAGPDAHGAVGRAGDDLAVGREGHRPHAAAVRPEQAAAGALDEPHR